MPSTRYSCQIFMRTEFSRQIYENSSNIEFHQNPFSGNRVVPSGQTDERAKLIVAFSNFMHARKNSQIQHVR
jgi:hypothetical protein